jgi:hypothetical protein
LFFFKLDYYKSGEFLPQGVSPECVGVTAMVEARRSGLSEAGLLKFLERKILVPGDDEYRVVLRLAGKAYAKYWAGTGDPPAELSDSFDVNSMTRFAVLKKGGVVVAGLRWIPEGDCWWFFPRPKEGGSSCELTRFCPDPDWPLENLDEYREFFLEKARGQVGKTEELNGWVDRELTRLRAVATYRELSGTLLTLPEVLGYMSADGRMDLMGVMTPNLEMFYKDCGHQVSPLVNIELFPVEKMTVEAGEIARNYANYWLKDRWGPRLAVMSKSLIPLNVETYVERRIRERNRRR